MGNAASGEEGRHRLGYHVLRVKEGSPADRAGIRPFFDYIVGVNGIRLNKESTVLQDQMVANEGLELIPTTQWGDGKEGLLGCSIRFCMFDAANDVVWHVLDVYQGSPAERAGLCSHSDYIVGTPYGIMRGEGDLYDLVEDNAGEALRLYVYNSETDHVREVIIVPNYDWGGEGLLGCDVGYGYLHRLPRGPVGPTAQGTNAALKRSPSLPYPAMSTSQEPALASEGYARNTMPASITNTPTVPSSDIIAPTPRPTQSPTWLNPERQEKLSTMTTPRNTLDFYQGEQEDGGEGKGVGSGGEQDEPNHPPLLRFGKGNRPDAEDESDDEDFVPRHEPTTSNLSTQPPTAPQMQQQQPRHPATDAEMAAGVAGLAIQNTSAVSTSSPPSTTTTAAATESISSIQSRGNGNMTSISSAPSGANKMNHPQDPQHHHHYQPHHPPPHPVMTRFQARYNPGTTPPPSAAALESPFSQALAHPPYPNSHYTDSQGKDKTQDSKQISSPPGRPHHEQSEDEINFCDTPFGAGEVPNFASMMSRQQQQRRQSDEPPNQSPRSQRREQPLAIGVRTKHQAEPEGRMPATMGIAQAQAQSEEYRRAMEQYAQQFQ
ncbi:Golgi reassembly-stacking protein 2 [Actinomortierella wolfii]|nr:Golgi reassembly-stacking protein 2 [Actinomortierella wolfii]